ncbi:AraC family transcriptional regulator [Cohnella soli]|uniref:AraC family transcriptional regulator n=1 Tax=Cohnella soli TaxID=425005 RepID=A0ABW0I215_9BACL
MVQIPFERNDEGIFRQDRFPTLLYAGQISEEPNWNFPSHKHDDFSEIIYISEGEGQFKINDHDYFASKDDMIIYNCGVLHEERSNPANPLKTYFCGIGNLQIKGIEAGNIIPLNATPVISTGSNSRQVEGYVSTLFRELRSQDFGFETVCQNIMISLLVSVLRIVNAHEPQKLLVRNDSLGYRIKQYIDLNYSQDIPLHEIANHLYISPYYLSHIFKEEMGYSPIHYLIQRRIGEAKTMLLNTQLSVQEIAELVGYSNANYFSTLFKKATGKSPSEFRKTHLLS